MTATLLATKRVEKPWGRHHLYPGFSDPAPDEAPIGEIWFQSPHPDEPELLVKYLFTSQKLSVQDHPSDAEAHQRGLPRGKDECWTILAAEPDSTIAIGPKAPITADELRKSAIDGTIEQKLDWKPARAGDFFYSHSGVIHAIGGGLTLIEVQQNSDTTFRLYDYGSDRELHLKDGVAVADLEPWTPPPMPGEITPGRTILVEGPKFVLERWASGDRTIALPPGRNGWLVPIKGTGVVSGVAWQAGECVMLSGTEELQADAGSDLLFAYPGTKRIA